MIKLDATKLLASGKTLQILEFISITDFRSFNEITKKFKISNGSTGDYLQKLVTFGLVIRYKNLHTHEFEGWQTTLLANKKLEQIFQSIDNFKEDIPGLNVCESGV